MKPIAYCIISLSLLALLSACGGKDYEYVNSNDTKPGPGLFSGEDGVFTVFESKKKIVTEESQAAETVEQVKPKPSPQ